MVAFKLSRWSRETSVLYVRYAAVALASIPFAAGAAWGKQMGWNELVLLPVAAIFSLVTGWSVWKRLEIWQQARPQVSLGGDADLMVWAELLKTGTRIAQVSVIAHYSAAPKTWQEILAAPGSRNTESFLNRPVLQECCLTNLEPDDVLQQMMMGKAKPTQRTQSERPTTPEDSQVVPVPALLRGHPLVAGVR